MNRHSRDGDGCVVGSACNLVQALESRQNDTVPYITNAPVSFQSVGDCTAARNDIARGDAVLEVAIFVNATDNV